MSNVVPKIASDFSVDGFFRRSEPAAIPINNRAPSHVSSALKAIVLDESSEEEVDLPMIISKKPKPKVVREFCKAALANIKSEDEMLFA